MMIWMCRKNGFWASKSYRNTISVHFFDHQYGEKQLRRAERKATRKNSILFLDTEDTDITSEFPTI